MIAKFKHVGVAGRLRFLVEAESLFNDGTAAVAFMVAVVFVQSGHLPLRLGITTSFRVIGGASSVVPRLPDLYCYSLDEQRIPWSKSR